MWQLAAEASTPFLKLSWAMHKLGLKQGSARVAFKGLSVMTIVVFFLCRVLSCPLLVRHVLGNRAVFWRGALPALYWLQVWLAVVFCGVNWFWFYKLVRLAVGGQSKARRLD